MKLLVLALALVVLAGSSASAQFMQSVPHTTTHYDTYRHGNHTHTVPHTTMHYDNVVQVPHTSTHLDTYRHGLHYHTVPHTTTHYDSVNLTHGGGGAYDSSSMLSSPSVYTSPSYQSPVYASPTYASPVVTAPPVYSSPTTIANSTFNSNYAAPNVGSVAGASPTDNFSPAYSAGKPQIENQLLPGSAAVNKIPGRTAAMANNRGRTIVLNNPLETGGAINYTVNEFAYTITPGQQQSLNLDRDWSIKFDNGLGRQVTYRLVEGKYNFSVSEERGWDVRLQDEPLAPPAPPASIALPK